MFEGQVDSPKRLNILYDEVERHYYIIAKLTGAMAQKYVFKGCSKACKRDDAHVVDQTCSDCMVSPPCASPATTVIGILETPRFSRTTRCAHQIGNRCANVSGVARRADGS